MAKDRLNNIAKRIADITANAQSFISASASKGLNSAINRILNKYTNEITTYADGRIRVGVENLRRVEKMRNELNATLDTFIKRNVGTDFTLMQNKINQELSGYFSLIEKDWTAGQLQATLARQARQNMLSSVISTNTDITNRAANIVQSFINGGGFKSEMLAEFNKFIFEDGLTRYERHAGQIINDAFAGYVGAYTEIVAADLGLEWFTYAGPIVVKSRPFCRHMVDKEWFHKDELPDIVKGIIDGVQVSTAGMNDATTPENFIQLRGGYNCNHVVIPVPVEVVPDDIRGNNKK